MDKSDSIYFGCDAGCLDAPVPLNQIYTNFPVKLTKPLTAILYITSDHQHMQDLRNALHVHEVDDGMYIKIYLNDKKTLVYGSNFQLPLTVGTIYVVKIMTLSNFQEILTASLVVR